MITQLPLIAKDPTKTHREIVGGRVRAVDKIDFDNRVAQSDISKSMLIRALVDAVNASNPDHVLGQLRSIMDSTDVASVADN